MFIPDNVNIGSSSHISASSTSDPLSPFLHARVAHVALVARVARAGVRNSSEISASVHHSDCLPILHGKHI